MAQAQNIVDIEPSDGLPEMARMKINRNNRRLASMASGMVQTVQTRQVVDMRVEEATRGIVASVFDVVYPVGCVIATSSPSDPRLGTGTWSRVAADRFVMGAGPDHPVMSTGGSEDFLPPHSHGLKVKEVEVEAAQSAGVKVLAGDDSVGMRTEDEGGQALPPYVALLFYRRTA